MRQNKNTLKMDETLQIALRILCKETDSEFNILDNVEDIRNDVNEELILPKKKLTEWF